jgi:3-hydroxybutyryl-CoA dehydrogenase
MKIILLCNTLQKEELITQDSDKTLELVYCDNPGSAVTNGAGACIDLLFDNTAERVKELTGLQTKIIIVNSVIVTLNDLPPGFVRINGWNTFLKRSIVEASGPRNIKKNVEQVFSGFNKKTEWVADIPGFITARVVASIINEAYFSLQEKVSSKNEIDTAMKLGTNYPYGPFEWSQKIGLKNIFNLLSHLSEQQKRYTPAELLGKEASI